ncbi:MAG: hypothetical protein II336_18095 [Loktanella sp.]|nr:hypothetical protein [Loktanella sp.]
MNRNAPPVLVTAPVLPVVTLADMRAHLRMTAADDDAQIVAIERAAVAHLDGWRGVLGRCLMPQTWRQDFDGWGRLRIAMPDADDITVSYRDADGAYQPQTDVVTGIDALGPYVDAAGPDTGAVRVEYVCAMPVEQLDGARMAVKLMAEHLYDGSDLSPAFGALVAAMRWRTA